MDRSTVLGLIAFMSAFFAALFILDYICDGLRNASMHRRSRNISGEADGFGLRLLRNGVPLCKSLSRRFLRNDRIGKLLEEGVEILVSKGFKTRKVELCSLVIPFLILIAMAGWVIGGSAITGLVMLGGSVAAAISYLNYKKEKKSELMRESIPDALRSMSVCSHAGFSLQQTFYQVATEVNEPLCNLFKKATHDLETGQSIEVALQRFRMSSQVSELVFISVALDVQHRAGGSLRQVLEAACDSVESELELKRRLRVQTAQAKLSARIVTLMPFLLIAVFSFLSPGFLSPFFQSVVGMALLFVAIFMQVSGILMVRRMLKIEVG